MTLTHLTSRTRRGRAVALCAGAMGLALALGACGEDSPGTDEPTATDTPTETATPPTETPTETPTDTPTAAEPACSEVWVAGQPLPKKYAGCLDDATGKFIQPMVYPCSSGQKIVTHRRNFYARKGGNVVETSVPLARDPEFQKILDTCGA